MRDEIDAILEGLTAIKHNIFDYIKKFFVFLFLYGRMIVIPLLFALGAFFVLHYIEVFKQLSSIIFKVILIVGQIIPAASYAGIITNDKNVEGSMDVCFSGIIISSLLIWYAL